MKYTAFIQVMPLKELLDPQGKAVSSSLHNLGLTGIDNVRIGKNISLEINAATSEEARQMAEDACKKLLCNAVMESYHITINEA